MFGDIGWAELMLIGVVALIVIGPEDLPQMFRQLGRFTAKIKSMSRDFSRAMEQAAKDTGVNDVAKDLRAATSPKAMGLDKVKEAADRFEKWDPMKGQAKPAAKPLVPAPMPATPKPVNTMSATSEPTIMAPATDTPIVTNFGPATQALAEKQAAKKAILQDTAAKLKAVTEGSAVSATPPPTRQAIAPKPRAARKPKQADQA